MPSDQLVDAKVILGVMADLKRQGIDKVLQDLEATERDLADFVLEELSLLHKRMLETGGRPKQIQRLYRQVQNLVLVSILSLRAAHYRLWQQETSGTPLAQLDAASDSDPPPTATHSASPQ